MACVWVALVMTSCSASSGECLPTKARALSYSCCAAMVLVVVGGGRRDGEGVTDGLVDEETNKESKKCSETRWAIRGGRRVAAQPASLCPASGQRARAASQTRVVAGCLCPAKTVIIERWPHRPPHRTTPGEHCVGPGLARAGPPVDSARAVTSTEAKNGPPIPQGSKFITTLNHPG